MFPNPGSAIGLHKQYSFVPIATNVFKTIVPPNEDVALLHVNRTDPVKVIDTCGRESITIVLNPLGIKRFIKGDLCLLVKANGGPSYIPLQPVACFAELAKKVFAENTHRKSLAVIEQALLTIFDESSLPS